MKNSDPIDSEALRVKVQDLIQQKSLSGEECKQLFDHLGQLYINAQDIRSFIEQINNKENESGTFIHEDALNKFWHLETLVKRTQAINSPRSSTNAASSFWNALHTISGAPRKPRGIFTIPEEA